MAADKVAAGPGTRTHRAGWGWLFLSALSRVYLVFMGTLAAGAMVPVLFGLSGAVVQSGSMEPLINAGDVVMSRPLAANAPTPMGRVITFRAPAGAAQPGNVLHRLVAKNKNGSLVTAGDANADPDSTPLERRNIISQARLLIPWIGLPSFWARTGAFVSFGVFLLLTMGALITAALEASTRAQEDPRPPESPGPPAGQGPCPENPGEATQPGQPHEGPVTSLLNRVRVATEPAAVALVAVLTAGAMAMAPLGVAAAAFSATVASTGNTWGTAGPATMLAFTTNPAGSTGGIAFATQPEVTVLDADGNTVGVSSAPVTLSITTAAGASLTCAANPTEALAGVATFAGCRIDKAGSYTVTATSGTLATAVSAGFTISAGAATKLAFTTNPSGSTGGIAFTPQPVVAFQDAGGNTTVGSNGPVSLSITTPAGATLTCTANPRNALAGVATFAGCAIDKARTYTLTATSGTLATAVSASFTISAGAATKLAFTTSPTSSNAAIAFAAQPVVAVRDAGGNTVTGSNAPVSLSITTPAGATLTCTANPRNALAGVATFAGCAIDKAGTYTLTATSGTLAAAVSAYFTITAGTAIKLAFTTSPSSSNAAIAFAAQPVVAVQDAGGNTVPVINASVSLAITTPAGATLSCTANPKPTVAGVATFAGCAINNPGTYTLTATSAGLASAVSASFTITVGSTAKLVFSSSPSGSTAGIAFGRQPVVAVQDAGGHTVTTSTAPVTLVVTTPAGAILTCTANPANAAAGVATFAGCRMDKTGTYTLTATSAGLTNAVSASFTVITGAASKVAFATSPSGSTGGMAFAAQPVVAVQDASGNPVTTSSASVALTLTTPAGAILTCTANPVNAVAGIATFAGCGIDVTETYTLTATSAGLTDAISEAFTVTVGPATQLGYTTAWSDTAANTPFILQPEVAVQDAGGNTVSSSGDSVTLAITTPAAATLACAANPETTVAGIATFAGCQIDRSGTYTLTASSSGLTNAISASFSISAGPATTLTFTTNPTGATGGTAFAAQPVVAVQDASGNTTTGTNAVTLTITTPAGAILTCATNPANAVTGIVTFAGCGIDRIGTYTLTASSVGLTNAISSSITITLGPASKLAFTTSPTNTSVNSSFSAQPKVAIQDAGGNPRATSSASVTLTITPPTGGATLSCSSNPRNTSSGVASFSSCKINTSGTYTLTATASGLTAAVSASFTVSGPATKLAFTTSPSSSTSGTAFGAQPVVAVQDAAGNKTTGSNSVTLTITTPAGATLTCSSNPRNASNGVATFAGCSIKKAGAYTLTAAASGLTSAVSASFTITAGPATKLSFTTSPSSSMSGTAFAAQPVVAIQDAGGNTVTSSGASVTLSITTPAGATLSCAANPTTALAGVNAFAGCSIIKKGTYTLTAAATGLANAVSNSFTISAGPATKLAFTTNPTGSTGGISFGTQPVVRVTDEGGNTVTSSNASVTLAITTPAGATLTCSSNPRTASSGVATFSTCKINVAGTYTLTASSGILATAVSTSFTVTVGTATKLGFTTSPSSTPRNTDFASQPVVALQDAGGNTVASSSALVTLTLTYSSGGATLTCTQNQMTTASGVAVFAGCRINNAGTYTLTSSGGGLTNGVSSSFTIN